MQVEGSYHFYMESLDRREICPDASWVRIIDQTCDEGDPVLLEQGGSSLASEFQFIQELDEINDCKYWRVIGVLGQCGSFELDFDPPGKGVQMDLNPTNFRFEIGGLPDMNPMFASKSYCEYQ